MSEDTNEIELDINPGRLCFGLSRIGYTPASALCDIVDNSVVANATFVEVLIIKDREDFSDNRKNNVKEYIIVDDGDGMDRDQLKSALALGASDLGYGEHSLSKFGLGLKSASFSQGDELHLISSIGESFNKYVVPLLEIKDKYFAREESLSQEDEALIKKYLSGGKGTIVRLGKVRNINHPSVKNTVEELKEKLGVIYYYFMKNDGLKIRIDGEDINEFDSLFVNEAKINGNLNENDWDGKTVKWIAKPQNFVLDTESGINAKIEVTQLPHPPTFEYDERGGQAKARSDYRINASNYGYYVYRNKRLISWAEHFDGIVPYDQDFYSFRGRILIDDSADDCFNIDVKKSTLTLSEEARNTISDVSDQFKRKSKKAWGHAKSALDEKKGEDPNYTANEIIGDLSPPEFLPGQPVPSEEEELEIKKRVEEVQGEMLDNLKKMAIQERSEAEGKTIGEEELTAEDIEKTLKGDANPSSKRIFRVASVEDNLLWEPYYDADEKGCVRINKMHRFSRLIFEDNCENADLQIILELILLQMAEAEVYAQKMIKTHERNEIGRLLTEYRRFASEYLADMCRQLEGKLPPLKK